MSKHCGAVCATTSLFADLEIVDLRVEVIDETGVLAHRALRLTGRPGGEEDVGDVAGGNLHAQVAFAGGFAERVGKADLLDLGQRPQCPSDALGGLVLGDEQRAPRTREHRLDAIRREPRLDRQVDAARLQDADHGAHPAEGPFGGDSDDSLTLETAIEQ